MDRILREERKYILGLCKKIKKAGCNVLLIQKSILRDAYNDLSLHFLAKMEIMVITDVERNDVEFVSRTLGCQPVAHVDSFAPEKLGAAELCEEISVSGGGQRVCKITGVQNPGRTISILLRGSNKLVLDEADRSVHDALCVVRSLVKLRHMIAGGGAAETELSLRLTEQSAKQTGMRSYCMRAFADALEVIPYTLAENAGLNPIDIVTELRKHHAEGSSGAGINALEETSPRTKIGTVTKTVGVCVCANPFSHRPRQCERALYRTCTPSRFCSLFSSAVQRSISPRRRSA
jgi:T-complex protein 1 subunit delta